LWLWCTVSSNTFCPLLRLFLNLAGRDKGAYYHELFLRSKRFLSHRIQRIKIKGKGARKPSSPETEPNFYNAPYLPATIAHSKNPGIPSVGNLLPLGMNPGTVPLHQLRAYPASFQNQQAHLPPLLDIMRLQEFQARAQLQQLYTPPAPMHMLPMLPMRPNMLTLPNFQQQENPMVYGRQDGSAAAMAAALSHPNPDPSAFAGLSGYWRG
jgi:hypothetical protein